jgi:Tfp pilus assembly protein PilX
MRLLKNGESGQAMVMALILLTLGSLLVVPTLSLSVTSLKYHQVVEENTLETSAADAGVQYALCKLGNNEGAFATEPLPSEVNDSTVNVTVEDIGGNIYKITSTATTDADSSTTIESYVLISRALFDNAITSPGDVTLKPGTEVNGDVQYNGQLDNKGDIYGQEITAEIKNWPTAEELSALYWEDVKDLTPLPDGYVIDISSGTLETPYLIGPLYATGNLTITGSGVARLDGTIYVSGDLTVNPTPSCTILLNMQAIYTEGSITFQPGTTTSGSGCITAVGNIDYQPNISGDDFVFLMSLTGTVTLKPGTSFFGSVAGNCEVELMPGTTLNWVAPADGLNFPAGSGELNIITWQILG